MPLWRENLFAIDKSFIAAFEVFNEKLIPRTNDLRVFSTDRMMRYDNLAESFVAANDHLVRVERNGFVGGHTVWGF
jgi:hypothetical protein